MAYDYRSFTERMQVTVPEGEVDGLVVGRVEVKSLDDWTDADEGRKDVMHPLEYVRLMRDGREPEPGWYTRLYDTTVKDDDGHLLLWMSDTTVEREDHKEAVARIQLSKAERVLINGLGLGMVLQAALTYDHVTHVDVVEKDERVIELVGPHYLKDKRVNIIHADAYEQMGNWSMGPRQRWHVAWSDIWPDISADNVEGMDQLHKYYRNRAAWHGMWCRKMCLQMRRELQAYGVM